MTKTTALLSAMALGASAFAMPAVAQTNDSEIVPGNATATDEQNAEERDAVADDDAVGDGMANEAAGEAARSTVPGNTQEIDNQDAAERDAIAEGVAGGNAGANPESGEAAETQVPGAAPEAPNQEEQDEVSGE